MHGGPCVFRSLATGARPSARRDEAIIGACGDESGPWMIWTDTRDRAGRGPSAAGRFGPYVMTQSSARIPDGKRSTLLDSRGRSGDQQIRAAWRRRRLRERVTAAAPQRGAFGTRPEDMPVSATSAATFNDRGQRPVSEWPGCSPLNGPRAHQGVMAAAARRISRRRPRSSSPSGPANLSRDRRDRTRRLPRGNLPGR